MTPRVITIGNNTYEEVSEYEFIIPLSKIGTLRICDIPTYGRVRIPSLKKIDGVQFILEAKSENTPDDIYHQIGFVVFF